MKEIDLSILLLALFLYLASTVSGQKAERPDYLNPDLAAYTFGFGLSYSRFAYSGLKAQRTTQGAQVSVRVKNDSARDGDEVIQLYVNGGAAANDPIRSLRGFQRIHLRAGESRIVQFTLGAEDVPKEKVRISVGGGQPGGRLPYLETMI
jgi:beta-glucosidase